MYQHYMYVHTVLPDWAPNKEEGKDKRAFPYSSKPPQPEAANHHIGLRFDLK